MNQTEHIDMHHANDRQGILTPWQLWTAKWRGLPSVAVIGVEKGGTSSLAMYLNFHPGIAKPRAKEARYFLMHHAKGLEYYRGNFPLKAIMDYRKQITYDASPMYMFYDEVKHRIKSSGLDFKFVVLLREPAARAYSHFQMNLRNGIIPQNSKFADFVDREIEQWDSKRSFPYEGFYQRREQGELTYLARSYYAKQLREWFEIFPPQNFIVKQTEELGRNPSSVMQDIYEFLGLEPDVVSPKHFTTKYHAFDYSEMQPSTQRMLRKFFAPLNQELYELIGTEWEW